MDMRRPPVSRIRRPEREQTEEERRAVLLAYIDKAFETGRECGEVIGYVRGFRDAMRLLQAQVTERGDA